MLAQSGLQPAPPGPRPAPIRPPYRSRAPPVPGSHGDARPGRTGQPRPSYLANSAARAARCPRPLRGGPDGEGQQRWCPADAGGGGDEAGAEAGAGNRRAERPAASPSNTSREIANQQPIQCSSEEAGRGNHRKRGTSKLPPLRSTPLTPPSLYGLARESKGVGRPGQYGCHRGVVVGLTSSWLATSRLSPRRRSLRLFRRLCEPGGQWGGPGGKARSPPDIALGNQPGKRLNGPWVGLLSLVDSESHPAVSLSATCSLQRSQRKWTYPRGVSRQLSMRPAFAGSVVLASPGAPLTQGR